MQTSPNFILLEPATTSIMVRCTVQTNKQQVRLSGFPTVGGGFHQNKSGLHPNLAAGFHHIAKARQGSFITWKDAHMPDMLVLHCRSTFTHYTTITR